MAYILKRTDQGGGYVARSGHASSYTKNIEHVRTFATREEAEKHRCVDNEIIVDMAALTS